jgi:hypothetical protein
MLASQARLNFIDEPEMVECACLYLFYFLSLKNIFVHFSTGFGLQTNEELTNCDHVGCVQTR